MQIKSTQLNNNRLSGNKLFLHTFKNFSTTSAKVSIKMHIVHALISILILLSIFYMIILVAVVFNIVNKRESLANINNINVKTVKFEREYNSIITNLNKDFALSNGFLSADDKIFASRKDSAASLSFLYEIENN